MKSDHFQINSTLNNNSFAEQSLTRITESERSEADKAVFAKVNLLFRLPDSSAGEPVTNRNSTKTGNATFGIKSAAAIRSGNEHLKRTTILEPRKSSEPTDAFERFRKCLQRYARTALSNLQFEEIRAKLRPKTFRKRQYFLQEGEICKYFGFVVKGAMRQYSVDDKGVEHFIRLSLEDCWVGDRESWVMLSPSIYHIDAWEDTEMLIVTKEDSLKLCREIPAYDEMLRSMDERYSIATQKRVHAAISLPADKRYADFVNNYPDLLQRFPQHIIASYLGVTKDTLSRVRKQLLK